MAIVGMSATNAVTRIDADTFTFQSRNRAIDGRQEPDIEEIETKREPLQGVAQDGPASPKKPARETILP